MRLDQKIHTIDTFHPILPNSQNINNTQHVNRGSLIFMWPPESESLSCERVRNRLGRTRRKARKICFAKNENGKTDSILFISDTQWVSLSVISIVFSTYILRFVYAFSFFPPFFACFNFLHYLRTENVPCLRCCISY